ncbi:thiamine/thiamine pyrophosphate ABC transporter permease ThiP [Pasteurellaceae bacterium RH1A]|nr:thiamine/thiamine pyrophosphate ABC transporter permease ThiP [Pasteurellaceae bacterium RH1A]
MLRKLTQTSAWAVYSIIVLLYVFSLWALFDQSQASPWRLADSLFIIEHSLWQAGLSALGSTVCGLLLARAFFYLHFWGKDWLYKVMSFACALPSLVAIFAVIGVWGNAGWLAKTFQFFGLDWHFQLYGLQGILIAHFFLNIPLVAKYCLTGLRLIPSNHHRLAAQLNLRHWHYFKQVELPALKGILPYAFATVFLICFTSFPIVLMLGGGPKYSTLEVAIYQAVTFEFDLHKAVMLIGLQVLIGLVLQIVMDLTTRYAFSKQQTSANQEIWTAKPTGWGKWGLQAVLILHIFAILLPLASVLWEGLSVSHLGERLQNPELWKAALFSLLLSLIASFSVILMVYLIALEARQLAFKGQKLKQSILAGVVTYPLILPIFLLAVGLFMLLMEVELSTVQLLFLVGICNGITLLPFIYRLIFSAMWNSLVSHDKLAKSLGLTGFKRWWIVEKKALIRPLANAFALAMSFSLGSFAVIAFFGSPDFSSLPYLLYQQLGSYRTEDAAVTALVLMAFALLPFLFIEQKENLK